MSDDVVNARGLKFSYAPSRASSFPVLEIPALSLKAGERLFLHGESGSGKSTLLGLIAGVLKAQDGELWVLGQNFVKSSAATRDALRGERMGYIFQLFNLIPYLSVGENISLPCRLHNQRQGRLGRTSVKAEVKRLAEALGIGEFLDRGVSELSVGQQQRVAAARALMAKPELIIADEPTSALDHAHRGRFIELLMQECAREKSALLFVSHDPTLAPFFDRKISMDELKAGAGA